MRKLCRRICAYIIDILIISIITQSLASTTILNPNLNKYQKYSKEYNKLYSNYVSFIYQLQNDYQDSKLTEKEYKKLVKSYPEYEENINEYYQNKKLTEKKYNKLIEQITKEYEKKSSGLYYLVEKNAISEMIIYLIITVVYFVFFNYLTQGQTLGKKVTKLKIINEENQNKKVKIINYIIRMLPLYQIIYYTTRLICIFLLKKSQYIEITSMVYYLQSILTFITIATLIIRKDGRCLHDLLAKTKVIMYDKNGNII